MMKYLFASLLLVAACGDNDSDAMNPEDSTDDVTPDAEPDAPAAAPRAVVVAGDFAAGAPGVLSTLDVATLTVTPNAAAAGAVSSDPIIRKAGNSLYVVNRFGANNVTILDASTFAVQAQIATGEGSNPQDVAVASGKLYIPALGAPGVLVATAAGISSTITLDIDEDELPDCASAYTVGTDVYVACGTLDENFMARGPATVVVIDSTTDRVRATFELVNANPLGYLEQLPGGNLVIATVPTFGGTDGCLEQIVPGATPTAGPCLVTNAELGGYVARAAVQDANATLLWLAVSAFPAGKLVGFDLETDSLWTPAVSPAAQTISDVAVCPGGEVVVSDTTEAASGLRLYVGTTETTTAALPVGIAPKSSHGLLCY